MTDKKWAGRICVMCLGTGMYFISDPNAEPMTTVKRNIPTSLSCPACNGHGREPADEPVDN